MLNNLNNWLVSLDNTLTVGALGAAATLAGALIVGTVALLVVWAQNRISRQGILAQERSPYLSLIERRAVWLDYAVSTWSEWIAQQEQRIEAIIANQPLPSDEPLRAISNCRREARWLFGPEIDELLGKLEIAVRNYSSARMAMRQLGMQEPDERTPADVAEREEAFRQALGPMLALQSELSHVTRPYLYVGDIRVKALPELLERS